jgi:hypothetical protein
MKTLNEVMFLFPCTERDKWKQHTNGKGWVYHTATVSDTAFIEGIVSGNARVYGDAGVSGNARVYGNARVSGDARVYGNAQVYGNARVFGDAQVSGDAWTESPLYIQGTKHPLTLCSHTEIAIGCHVLPISEWKKRYRVIGSEEGYTPAQIKEYGTYIALLAATAKRLKKVL